MLIDAHSHLDGYDDERLGAVLDEIAARRIFTISSSIDPPSYQKNLDIARRSGLVLPTFGVHPSKASTYAGSLPDLDGLIERTPVLGEIGLDYHWVRDRAQYPAQREVFRYFLEKAARQDKIVILHTKGAEQEVLDLLDQCGIRKAIIHWYSGPRNIFEEMVRRGCMFTVSIEVVFSARIQEIAASIPGDQLLTEMDNPSGQEWLTGTPGMPGDIGKVVDKLAEVRNSTPEEITRAVRDNFRRLIRDDPRLAPVLENISEKY